MCNKKETAIPNEQQLNIKCEIIDEIIKILSTNNLTIAEAKDVLYNASKKLNRQKIIVCV